MNAACILVTGIGGAVGNELAAVLADRAPKAEIIGVFSGESSRDAFLERSQEQVVRIVRPMVCDLTDSEATAGLAATLGAGRPTVLVHAAANVSWSASHEAAWRGNVELTRNIADLARALGNTRFLLVSTAYTALNDCVYRNAYEETKAAAERMLRTEYPDLDLSVFSCSLVVGHSQTGDIARFHGLYPLIGLLERYQLPFMPGDEEGRIDIVPVDWVAEELYALVERLLDGGPAAEVVAAAGLAAPKLSELTDGVLGVLNRIRRADGRPELDGVPVVPFRRWDFLRRSIGAWGVQGIPMPNHQFLTWLIGIYRPYFEGGGVRPPSGVTRPAPDWRDYVDIVVERWQAEQRRRR